MDMQIKCQEKRKMNMSLSYMEVSETIRLQKR